MTYSHGITITDGGTLGTQIALTGNTIPVFVGCAWGLTTTGTAPLTAKKINNFQEYIDTFGWANRDGDVIDYTAVDHDYTLDEVAWAFFKLYKIGPIICINVYNATDHPGGVGDVDATDIAGGLALIEGAMSLLNFIPSHIACPRYSQDGTLKTAMIAMNEINSIPIMIVVDLADAPADDDVTAKGKAIVEATALDDDNLYMCWPERGGYPLSTIAVAIAEWVRITRYAGIPMNGPSNKDLLVDLGDDDRVVLASWLDSLNEVGVATWKQLGSSCVLWGSQLAAYDSGGTADYINDTYIPRRMLNYVIERIMTEMHESVDEPTNIRLIEDTVAKMNDFGGALKGKGAMLGFSVSFFQEKNSLADLVAGKITFTVTLLPPREASTINFDLIVDINYLNTLFE